MRKRELVDPVWERDAGDNYVEFAAPSIKDYQPARFRSLFGDVELRVPRYTKCGCTGVEPSKLYLVGVGSRPSWSVCKASWRPACHTNTPPKCSAVSCPSDVVTVPVP